jgi:mannitol-1-phosphate/altronate dehydrogenase
MRAPQDFLEQYKIADTQVLDLPYDPAVLTPSVVHIGFGKFAQAFVVEIFNDLAALGYTQWGITAVAPTPRREQYINKLRAQNFVYTLIKRNGNEILKPVGALRDVVIAQNNSGAVIDLLANPQTKLVTTTVTQAGYCVDANANFHPTQAVKKDIQAIRDNNRHTIQTMPGWITGALYERYISGLEPFDVISFDNLPRNGDMVRNVILSFAQNIKTDFARYVERRVLFPNSVVDRVTPHQNFEDNQVYLSKFGIEDYCALICEPFRSLHVQDTLHPELRPPLHKVDGAMYVPVTKPIADCKLLMLNGSHLSIAVISKILQIPSVREATQDRHVRAFWLSFLDQAANALRPIAPEHVDHFKEHAIDRLDNPHITDKIDRLLRATKSKVRARLLNKQALHQNLPAHASAFAIAAWLHYMQGRDFSSNAYHLHEKDVGKLQQLGLTEPATAPDKLQQFLTKDTSLPQDAVRPFVQIVLDDYRLIAEVGMRQALERRFPPRQEIQQTYRMDSAAPV